MARKIVYIKQKNESDEVIDELVINGVGLIESSTPIKQYFTQKNTN